MLRPWFLFLSLLLSLGAAHAEDQNQGVTVFAPTTAQNTQPGRNDPLRLEITQVDLSETAELLNRLRSVLPAMDPQHPPVIAIYIASERSTQEVQQIIQTARTQFRQAFPTVVPQFEIHYLGDRNARLRQEAANLDDALNQVARLLPQDHITAAGVATLHTANQNALQAALNQHRPQEDLLSRIGNPALSRHVLQGFGAAKALLSVLMRGSQAMAGGMSGGPVGIAAGLALVVGDSGIRYFYGRYQTEVDLALTNHGLPLPSGNAFIDRIKDLYARSKVVRFIKSSIAHAAIFGVILPATMQTLAHFNNPEFVRAVSGGDMLNFTGFGIGTTLAYSGGVMGFEGLRQNGWISRPLMDYVLRAFAIIGVVESFMVSSGRPELLSHLPYLLIPTWAALGIAYIASAVLPRRNRFVVVDQAITDRQGLNAREGLESTRTVEGDREHVEQAVRDLTAPPPARAGGTCPDNLGRFGTRAN